jgi:hypothetical protein
MTEQPKTIQLEPTWLGLLPVLLELAHNADHGLESRQTALRGAAPHGQSG